MAAIVFYVWKLAFLVPLLFGERCVANFTQPHSLTANVTSATDTTQDQLFTTDANTAAQESFTKPPTLLIDYNLIDTIAIRIAGNFFIVRNTSACANITIIDNEQQFQSPQNVILFLAYTNCSHRPVGRALVARLCTALRASRTLDSRLDTYCGDVTEQLEAARRNSTTQPPPSLSPAGRLYFDVVADQLFVYVPPVLIALGTLGNAMSVVVVTRKRIRATTTSLILVVLAAVDTANLYTGLLRYYIRQLSGYDLRLASAESCRVHLFAVYFIQQFNSWVLVLLTAERLVAVFLPYRAKDVCTKTAASIVLVITALVLTCINIPFFFTHQLIEVPAAAGSRRLPVRYCAAMYEMHKNYLKSTWPWLDFSLFSLLPFIFILVSNVAIVGRLLYSRFVRQHQLQASNSSIKLTSMTAILFTVSLMFFITTAPISIYLIGQTYWKSGGGGGDIEVTAAEAAYRKSQLHLAWAVVNLVCYTNNATNFLLYCISGPRFRKELFAMFKWRKNRVGVAAAQHTVSFELAQT